MRVFDQVIALNEYDLDPHFVTQFSTYLSSKIRGFGYWVWKPQVLLQVLNLVNIGDVILYADVGCHLNFQGRKRLFEYFELASKSTSGLLVFQAKRPVFPLIDDGREIPHWIDRDWTKGDLLDYFEIRNDLSIIDSPTIQSGAFFIRKDEQTINIIQQWLEIYKENFSLMDDSPSISPNYPSFIEHRHDQSAFSILAKQNNATCVSASEFWLPISQGSPKGDWEYLEKFPIHAKRDLDFGLMLNVVKRLEKQYKFEKQRIKQIIEKNLKL